MKKTIFLGFLLSLVFANVTFAASQSFVVTANVPKATTVSFAVSEVTPPPVDANGDLIPGGKAVWQSVNGTDINFVNSANNSKMVYNSKQGTWGSNHYFAIDLSPTDALGTPSAGSYNNVSFAYAEVDNPNGAGKGLGNRATITAIKAVYVEGAPADESTKLAGTPKALSSAINIPGADIAGGWLRVYVGLADGSVPGVPAFTNADKPGNYKGTLTITATLI